jgi:hypothetical protein
MNWRQELARLLRIEGQYYVIAFEQAQNIALNLKIGRLI